MGEWCRRCGESAHRYSPDHPQHGPQGRWGWQACVNSLLSRAERAEGERNRLLRFVSDVAAEEPGNVAEQFRTIRRLAQNIVADLSADADADAEPSRAKCDRCGHDVEGHTPAGCWVGNCYCAAIRGKREPSRAEGDEQLSRLLGASQEVNPDGDTDGTVLHREGDDGRSRAIAAITGVLNIGERFAPNIIDTALNSGGVAPMEDVDHEFRKWLISASRVRELETALRFYADPMTWKRNLTPGHNNCRYQYSHPRIQCDRGERARTALNGGSHD